jgi:hypothetical protein
MRHYQPAQRFIPSNYGGEGEEEGEGPRTPWQSFIAPLRDVIFGESAREKAAKIDVKIESMRRKAEGTGPVDWLLHNYYIDEIEKMKQEAELNADADLKKKEAVESKNTLDTLIYQTEKQIGEAGDKLPADKKTEIEAVLAEGKTALATDNPDEMKAATEKIQTVFAGMAQDMYPQGDAEGAAPPPPQGDAETDAGSSKPADDDVVDADFEVVDEDKK